MDVPAEGAHGLQSLTGRHRHEPVALGGECVPEPLIQRLTQTHVNEDRQSRQRHRGGHEKRRCDT